MSEAARWKEVEHNLCVKIIGEVFPELTFMSLPDAVRELIKKAKK